MQSFKVSFVGCRKLVCLLALVVLVTSCGKSGSQPKIVQDILLNTRDIDGEVTVDLGVTLDIGNVQLPTVTIPVFNPKNPSVKYGEVRTRGGFSGLNDIEVSVNLTQALEVQGGQATLPDGSPIPVGGLGNAAVVQIPLMNDQHRIYLAADRGVALLGAALTFKEFDQVGGSIRGADLMIPFMIRGVRGAFGFFTSTSSGKSGFAVFVDLGSLITPSEILASSDRVLAKAQGASFEAASSRVFESGYNRSSLYFVAKSTSRRKKKKFDKAMYKLHRKRKRLNINR